MAVRTLNVRKITFTELKLHWGEDLAKMAFRRGVQSEVYIQCNFKGDIRWGKASTYQAMEIAQTRHKRPVNIITLQSNKPQTMANKYIGKEPQPASYWISKIDDKTVNAALTEICSNSELLLPSESFKSHTTSFVDFLRSTFYWEKTKQGYHFWETISYHFIDNNGGLKTYEDFKHLDASVKDIASGGLG